MRMPLERDRRDRWDRFTALWGYVGVGLGLEHNLLAMAHATDWSIRIQAAREVAGAIVAIATDGGHGL